MGSSCHSEHGEPDTTNPCSTFSLNDSDSHYREIDNFCTIDGPGGSHNRHEMCQTLSNTGEWTYQDDGSGCHYNDCNNYQEMSSGCCKGCCGIIGHGVRCKRVKYTASPVDCCLANYDHTGNGCHFDNGNRTCPPSARSKVGTSVITDSSSFPEDNGKTCRDLLHDWCLGQEVDGQTIGDWKSSWKPGGVCNNVINWNLYGTGERLAAVNDEEGFQWTQKIFDDALRLYLSEGFTIGLAEGMPGYNEFQDTLYGYCTTVPGLCDNVLSQMCSSQTTNILLNNPGLIPWCGCNMADEEYKQWADDFQVPKSCTPICSRQGNIYPGLPNHSGFDVCHDNVCVMDQVAVEIANAELGAANFNQICGGCATDLRETTVEEEMTKNDSISRMANSSVSSACECIIVDDNIEIMNAKLGNVNLTQRCGGNATCYSTANGVRTAVDCKTGKPKSQNVLTPEISQREKEELKHRTIKMIIFAVVAVVIIVFFYFVFRPRGRQITEQYIEKRPSSTAPWPVVIPQVQQRSVKPPKAPPNPVRKGFKSARK